MTHWGITDRQQLLTVENLMVFHVVVLQVHPVCPQREPEERGELCAVPPGAARV